MKITAIAALAAVALSSCIGSASGSGWVGNCNNAGTKRANATISVSGTSAWRVTGATGALSGSTNVPSGWRSSGTNLNIGGNAISGSSFSSLVTVYDQEGDYRTISISASC